MQNIMNAESACGVLQTKSSKVGQHKLFVVAKTPCKECVITSLLASSARIAERIIFCGPDGMMVCKKKVCATTPLSKVQPYRKINWSVLSVGNSELQAALRRLHVGSVRSFLPIPSLLTIRFSWICKFMMVGANFSGPAVNCVSGTNQYSQNPEMKPSRNRVRSWIHGNMLLKAS